MLYCGRYTQTHPSALCTRTVRALVRCEAFESACRYACWGHGKQPVDLLNVTRLGDTNTGVERFRIWAPWKPTSTLLMTTHWCMPSCCHILNIALLLVGVFTHWTIWGVLYKSTEYPPPPSPSHMSVKYFMHWLQWFTKFLNCCPSQEFNLVHTFDITFRNNWTKPLCFW